MIKNIPDIFHSAPESDSDTASSLAARIETNNVETNAEMTARMLIEVGCIMLRPNDPFILTSGRASPVYVDCRRLISYPRERAQICDLAVAWIRQRYDVNTMPQAIAGGETAGIPFAAWIAERLDLPMLYVRKKSKGFGRDARIEGHITSGSRVLLIEDLATDGKSKLDFVAALRTADLRVNDVLVVFQYGIFPQAMMQLAEKNIHLHGLACWEDVMKISTRDKLLHEVERAQIRLFLEDPEKWLAKQSEKI